MANKRQVNVFNVAFLDLLSGALAAVIILFVVVPKMTNKDQEKVEIMEQLNLEANQLEEMIVRLENSVDSSEYKALSFQVAEVTQALNEANSVVNTLNRNLENQRNRIYRLNSRVGQLKEDVKLANENAKLFGVEAQLAIVYQWEENADVDIYFYSVERDEVCWYEEPNRSFASLLKDIQEASGDNYEMIYQEEFIPGVYEIYLAVYPSGSNNIIVRPKGHIITFPFSDRQKRVELRSVSLGLANRSKGISGAQKVNKIRVNSNGSINIIN